MSKRTSIEEIKNFAKLKGGYLLSENYYNNKEKLLWRCNCGNEWQTSWVDIKYRNSWCPACSSIARANKLRKYNIDDLNKIILEKNGILLSNQYFNCDSKLEIKCSKNHIFHLTLRQIEINNWCPECNERAILNQLKKIIKENNGELITDLTNEKIANKTLVLVRCNNNHIWKTKIYNLIYNKTWCPSCLKYEGEEKIKFYLKNKNIEYNRQHTFENLIGNTKRKTKLRFDFYLPKQNILIEYDGRQHYEPVNFGGCSDEQAQKTHLELKNNDKIKDKFCIENSIQLIRIPHTIKNVEEFLNKIIII